MGNNNGNGAGNGGGSGSLETALGVERHEVRREEWWGLVTGVVGGSGGLR